MSVVSALINNAIQMVEIVGSRGLLKELKVGDHGEKSAILAVRPFRKPAPS